MNKQDWLDKALSDNIDYINDDGFTEGILQCLPPSKHKRSRLHAIILSCATLFAFAVLFLLLLEQNNAYQQLIDFFFSQSLAILAVISISLSIVGSFIGWLILDSLDN